MKNPEALLQATKKGKTLMVFVKVRNLLIFFFNKHPLNSLVVAHQLYRC